MEFGFNRSECSLVVFNRTYQLSQLVPVKQPSQATAKVCMFAKENTSSTSKLSLKSVSICAVFILSLD